jgi:dihydroorotase
MRIILKNFRIVDEETDTIGTVVVDDGIISGVANTSGEQPIVLSGHIIDEEKAAITIDGSKLLSDGRLPILMPAFVDLHAHFRDPGFPEKEAPIPSEVLESASLAAVAGGFGTVVCMANTMPVIDSPEKALALKRRSDVLGLIDLHPVISLTKGMEGKELSGLRSLSPRPSDPAAAWEGPLMLSEDGRDIASDNLFLEAMKEAKRINIPISCHCDFGGENNAVRRVIELGKKAGCHIHIAHVSTKEAIEMIRKTRDELRGQGSDSGFTLTCEVMPHNLCLTEEDAEKLGKESWGRVNPPLRSEDDRKALLRAATDGTVDAIATDHAPHSGADKEKGAPGFSGFETAFAAAFTELVKGGPCMESKISLKRLSSLMSAGPARILGFGASEKQGRILPGCRAGLVIIDPDAAWIVRPENQKTRGKNNPFVGRELFGKILMTIRNGRIVSK